MWKEMILLLPPVPGGLIAQRAVLVDPRGDIVPLYL